MDRYITIYMLFFPTIQIILNILLSASFCDSWPNNRAYITIPNNTVERVPTAVTMTRTNVFFRNTTERRYSLRDNAATAQTLQTGGRNLDNSKDGFGRKGKDALFTNVVRPGDTNRAYPPNFNQKDRTSNITTGTGAAVKVKHHQIPEIMEKERASTGVFKVTGAISKRHQMDNDSARALALGVEISGPGHNSIVRSFASGLDSNIRLFDSSDGVQKLKRRQMIPGQSFGKDGIPGVDGPENVEEIKAKLKADEEAAMRFSTVEATTIILRRTTPFREIFENQCDYIAQYCMKTYQTGRLCGRTVYHNYTTFKSYCMLDYVNCMERYEMWQVVHMGQCYVLKQITEYIHYGYHEDYFLDHDYVADDQEWGLIG